LWDAGARVRAYDPEAIEETRRIFGERDDLVLSASAADALQDADAHWSWSPNGSSSAARISRCSRTRWPTAVVFDGRNLYEPAEVEAAGLAYYGIGRGRSLRTPGMMPSR
jgi:UDPglucose 6-dehydrogenase